MNISTMAAVAPYTTWNPTDGAIAKFKDPTSTGFYSTNLIRAMVGYAGYGQIPIWTYIGSDNYNALQVQLNRRVGRLQWNANYTFSRTIVYTQGNVGNTTFPPTTATAFNQWVNTQLTKNVINRPHALNFNLGYDLPEVARRLWNNGFTRVVLDGWHINGNGALYSGTPYTINCATPVGAPAGYWTGTPTGGMSRFNAGLKSGNVAAFNTVIPNGCDDGEKNCAPVNNRYTQFDDFLATEVPLIESSPAFGKDGVIIITYDESERADGQDPANGLGNGGHTVCAIISPLSTPGCSDRNGGRPE